MGATVVITTKNRKQELRQALLSCRIQVPAVEVLVVDDASSDGTSEMVRTEFPEVRLVTAEVSAGYIVQRNEGARLASGEVIFSIDDDAEFSSPDVVAQTLTQFKDRRVGAVAIPYIEPHKENREYQRAPDSVSLWVTDRYIGTAHALKKDLFLQLGGYREKFVHQGEEGDYCLRMMEAGYVVALGNSDRIIHHESPKRDLSRMDFYGRRNDVLFAWQNVPMPALLWRFPQIFLGGILFGLKCGRVGVMWNGILAGLGEMSSLERRPVSRRTFALHRQLRKAGPRAMEWRENPTQSA